MPNPHTFTGDPYNFIIFNPTLKRIVFTLDLYYTFIFTILCDYQKDPDTLLEVSQYQKDYHIDS